MNKMSFIKSTQVKKVLEQQFNDVGSREVLYLITKIRGCGNWDRILSQNFSAIYQEGFKELQNRVATFLTQFSAFQHDSRFGTSITDGVVLKDVNKKFILYLKDYLQQFYPQLKDLVISRYIQLSDTKKEGVRDFCEHYKERGGNNNYYYWYETNKYEKIYWVLLKIGLVRITLIYSSFAIQMDMIPEYITPEDILALVEVSQEEKIMESPEAQEDVPTDEIIESIGAREKIPKKTEKKFESPEVKLKNWNNPPELLRMTEEQGKGLTGGGTFAGVDITIGTSQVLKSLKLHKCHKCKSDNYALFDEDPNQEIIYCTKCGQKYKVLPPNGKIWSFKS